MFAGLNVALGSHACFGLFRTANADGSPNSIGFQLFSGGDLGSVSTSQQLASFRLSPPTFFGSSATYSFAPGVRTGSGGFGGEIEAYLAYYTDPLTRPSPFFCTIWNGEFSLGTDFDVALLGSTPRRYRSLAAQARRGDAVDGARLLGHALIWE